MPDLTDKQRNEIRDAVLAGLRWQPKRGNRVVEAFDDEAVAALVDVIRTACKPEDIFGDDAANA